MLPDWMEAYDAECKVLAAALLDPGTMPRAGCSAADFADARHRAVWSAAASLSAAGEPVDHASMVTRLEATGSLEAAGGPEYVADLYDAGGGGNVEYHGQVVREMAQARRAVRLLDQMRPAVTQAIREGAGEGRIGAGVRRALSTVAAEAIALLHGEQAGGGWVTMRDAKRAAIQRTRDRYEARQAGGMPADVLPTGIEALDVEIGGGLEAGHVCVVDGESGAGKTALMVRITRSMAAHLHGVDPDPAVSGVVLYYSCEVPGSDLAVRDIATASGVNGLSIRSGNLTDGELDRLLHSIGDKPGDHHWRIGFRPSAPVEWLVAEVRLIEETVGPVRAVIVDHWNELTTSRRGLRSDEREMAHILTQLDALKAPTDKCPEGSAVIIGAQHKANGGGLLWGNALKQKASYCWTWKTPGKGLPDDAGQVAHIERWKMRNGPLGTTEVRWDAATGRIL